MRHAFALALAVMLATPAAAQMARERVVSSAELLADVTILRRAYSEMHPGLLRYNTPEQLEAAFKALESEYGRDRPLGEAYLALSVFLAKIRCGHTYANFFNQRDDVVAALFQRQTRVPFQFRWLGRRMIVTRSFASDPALRAGAEVVAIDGVPVATILDSLMKASRADGGNDAKRVANLEVTGIARWEAFDIYHPLFFPRTGPRLRLEVRPPGTKAAARIEVEAQTHEQRLATYQAGRAGASSDTTAAFTLTYPDARTAVLRMPTWALYNSKWDWQAWLQKAFEDFERKQVRGLVIDLRDNEGGLDVGNTILAHLTATELRLPQYERWVRYRRAPTDLVPYLDTWDRSFVDWGEAAKGPDARGLYRLTKYDDQPGGDVIRPAGPRFGGRVLVLVGAGNSSAPFQFAQVLQREKLGRLVGQPTGGNQRGINGGAFFFLRLPNSHLEADLPLIARFPDREMPDAGLQPDVLVSRTAADIAKGRDAELETALALLRRGR
ncbi:MAG TPA: S41 family peptidase [Gemmatimonadales bacterium]|nr:S41 family peptidase [Gemmatimonadales bacterium]